MSSETNFQLNEKRPSLTVLSDAKLIRTDELGEIIVDVVASLQ